MNKIAQSLVILALTLSFTPYVLAQSYSTDFESQNVGTAYESAQWTSDGLTPKWTGGFDERSEVDNSFAVSGEQSLRIFYPEGNHGTAATGAQAPLQIAPQQEYYMSYWLRFSEDFSWGGSSQGGKLPGLAAGDNCSGCKVCDGTNGFTARFMWRTDGKAVLYLYHMDKVSSCGDDHEWEYPNGDLVYFPRGQWVHVMERVKINTSNNFDGEVQIWYNGNEVLNMDGIRFVNNDQLLDNFYFSTFHGGSGTNWNAQNDSYIWFDDLKISTQKEDVQMLNCAGQDLGPDQSLCGNSSITLSASTSDGRSFQWFKNGDVIDGETQGNLIVQEPGTYLIKADSLGCVATDEIVISDQLTPNLGEDITLCTESFHTLSAGMVDAGYSYNWYKDGVLIGSNSTLAIARPGTYLVIVDAENCDMAEDAITVESDFLNVVDDTSCAEAPFTLEVLATGNFEWLTSDLQHAGYGNIFESSFSSETHYLVQDIDGMQASVGMNQPKLSDSQSWADDRFERKMRFTVSQNITIESVQVYPQTAGDVVVRILDDSENELYASEAIAADAELTTITLGYELAPGDYLMDAVGTTVKLYHSNESDPEIAFPYAVEGYLSIDGSNESWIDQKPYYLFFYNWQVSAGNACAPTPVFAVEEDDCIVTGLDAPLQNLVSIPESFTESLEFSLATPTAVSVYAISGQLMEVIPASHSSQYQLGDGYELGIYILSIGNQQFRTVKR